MQRPFPGFRLEQLREMSMRRGGGASLEGKRSLVGDGFETPVRHRAGPGKGAVRRQTQDTGPRSGLEMSQGEPSAHGSDDRLFRPSGRDAPLASMEHLPRAGPPRAAGVSLFRQVLETLPRTSNGRLKHAGMPAECSLRRAEFAPKSHNPAS